MPIVLIAIAASNGPSSMDRFSTDA